ncbi:MAG: metal-dependent transcriptional regulator [Spirochaetales bacterium]|nr:metal-dependent transcriptional regulator [Spirochaetales bacterium]
MEITETTENYLKAVYEETIEKGVPLIPLGTLASKLGLTPGTVTIMVKRIAESGLLFYHSREGCELSPSGISHAEILIRKHRVIECFLTEMLGLDWSEVHEEAERLEHGISMRILEKFDELLGHPLRDPHGQLIPGRKGMKGKKAAGDGALISLKDVQDDSPVFVHSVTEEQRELLEYLNTFGISPGSEIRVLSRSDITATMRISVRGQSSKDISFIAAEKIMIKKR